jgi:hypothetical protein
MCETGVILGSIAIFSYINTVGKCFQTFLFYCAAAYLSVTYTLHDNFVCVCGMWNDSWMELYMDIKLTVLVHH